jgi:hypothetical protein
MTVVVMNSELDDLQSQEWEALYEKIVAVLGQWGTENHFGRADYLVVDDNYGWKRQKIEVHNLKMLVPEVVIALRQLLAGYPAWTIVMAVDIPGEETWPPMGVTIRKHEIIDGLRREYLPKEYQDLRYFGSRPGTGYD